MKRGPLELHPRVFRTDTRLFLPVNADPHIACLWDSNLKVHVHVRRVPVFVKHRRNGEEHFANRPHSFGAQVKISTAQSIC